MVRFTYILEQASWQRVDWKERLEAEASRQGVAPDPRTTERMPGPAEAAHGLQLTRQL